MSLPLHAIGCLALSLLALARSDDLHAQVTSIDVGKSIAYEQVSASSVVPASLPYGFEAGVRGTNLESLSPVPTLSGPTFSAPLTYRPGGTFPSWTVTEFFPDRAALEARAPSGTYTITVNGTPVALQLAGDLYPNPPLLTLTGGTWSGGKFYFDPGRPLTVTTNAFTDYARFKGVIFLGGSQQFAVNNPTNSMSVTIPAGTYAAGQEISLGVQFSSFTHENLTALPGIYAAATHAARTRVRLAAQPQPPPVFEMTVRANITPTVSSASADIQFRPQDVGTSGSIYTFAVAPATLVKGGLEKSAAVIGQGLSFAKADPPSCVLAQLNSSGQLIAVTTAQLQAYSSGTLSANGASVTILNNASTPAVAGATFYVGYGASSTAMINNGVYQSAVTVPGPSVCPMLSSQTALWWNPAENGWGVNFAHQGNILFGTLYTYDATGAPLWLMMSNGAMQSDGVTFTGDLYRTTGPAFNANPFTPITEANLTKVGTMTASFVDANAGTLSYTVNGAQVNKTIQRLVYGTRAASCLPSTASRATSTNYQDLWWNAAESGWGVNVTHQDNTLFATLFTYDATGKGLWLVMSGGLRQADGSYQGTLYRSSGPPFNANPFTPITEANLTPVGTMRFQFADGERGTLTYTVNGISVTKAITRLVFSSPLPACN